MIYRNEIPFDIETIMVFESDVDPSDYVQYPNTIVECMERKSTFVEIRFSWWSIGSFEGKTRAFYEAMRAVSKGADMFSK